MNNNGFISILMAIAILVVGSAVLYDYKQEVDHFAFEAYQYGQEIEKSTQIFGGSTVATRYGGTGQSWGGGTDSGLLRLTNGTTSTTTLTDADVPDDITVTITGELTLSTATIGVLTVTSTLDVYGAMRASTTLTAIGTSSFVGVSTFTAIPVLPASDPTTANQATRKAYVDTFTTTTLSHATSATLRNSNDAGISVLAASTSFVKVKEMLLNEDLGSFALWWDFSVDTGQTIYCQPYINGSATSTQSQTSDAPGSTSTVVKDLSSISATNLLQIYCKTNGGDDGYIDNMRLYYDQTITKIGGYILETPLAISNDTAISITNQDP